MNVMTSGITSDHIPNGYQVTKYNLSGRGTDCDCDSDCNDECECQSDCACQPTV
jgi:hypothetical protein